MTAFANKAASGLAKGLKVARVKSKEAVSVVSVRRHISQTSEERSSAVQELGEMVVAMLDDGALNEGALRSQRNEIAAIDERLRESEAELQAAHDQAAEELNGGEDPKASMG